MRLVCLGVACSLAPVHLQRLKDNFRWAFSCQDLGPLSHIIVPYVTYGAHDSPLSPEPRLAHAPGQPVRTSAPFCNLVHVLWEVSAFYMARGQLLTWGVLAVFGLDTVTGAAPGSPSHEHGAKLPDPLLPCVSCLAVSWLARPQVEVLEGRTECVLSNLRGGTHYTFAVRARMAEPSFSGFWSAWSEPASLLTASGEAPGPRGGGGTLPKTRQTCLTLSCPPRPGPPHPDAVSHPRVHLAVAGSAGPAVPPPVSPQPEL